MNYLGRPLSQLAASIVLALLFPMIVFAYFVRIGAPEFRLSAGQTMMLPLAAWAPIGLLAWQWLSH